MGASRSRDIEVGNRKEEALGSSMRQHREGQDFQLLLGRQALANMVIMNSH